MTNTSHPAILAVTALTLFCASASADLVTHALTAYGDSTLITVENFGTTHAAATNSYSSPGVFIGTAEAWSGYGWVRGTARADTQNAAYHTQLVQAEAGFTDTLTLGGASGPGFVVYQYTLSGLTLGGAHAAHAHMFLRHQGDPDEELGGHHHGGGTHASLPHAFTFGVPFTTGLLLAAEVHLHHGHSGTVLADFSAGAMLTGISIFDSQMNPVSQFTLVSESGTQYPLPTPGVVMQLAVGMLPLGRRVRRTHTRD